MYGQGEGLRSVHEAGGEMRRMGRAKHLCPEYCQEAWDNKLLEGFAQMDQERGQVAIADWLSLTSPRPE